MTKYVRFINQVFLHTKNFTWCFPVAECTMYKKTGLKVKNNNMLDKKYIEIECQDKENIDYSKWAQWKLS